MSSVNINNKSQKYFKKNMQGQALLFALLFTAAAGLIVILLFNNSQLAIQKTKLQNTADAAAYSAGVLMARDHNFSAYTNRAMIANQVAIAQWVSLHSYFENADKARKRMNDFAVLGLYQFLYPQNPGGWKIARQNKLINPAYKIIEKSAKPAVKGTNTIIDTLQKAQKIHHTGVSTEILFISNDVAKANEPNSKVNFINGKSIVDIKKWHDYTENHESNGKDNNASNRYVDSIFDKKIMDSFTTGRTLSGTLTTRTWASKVKFIGCPAAISSNTINTMSSSGVTALSSDKKSWIAMDAALSSGFWTCTWIIPTIPPSKITLGAPLVDIFGLVNGHAGASSGASTKYPLSVYKHAANYNAAFLTH